MQYDGLLTIATGSSRRCTNWKNKRILWSDLAAKLSNVTRTQETQAEYERMPKDERDRIKDVGGFVGGSLRTNRRKADSVCERQLITLDLDNVPQDTDPWPTVTLALGCAAVLYSTHSHTLRSPRLRLVLPLSRPVSPDEYGAIARKIAEDIGIDMCDDTTYQPHRLMYWASAATDAEFRYEVEDAPWLDADEQLSRYADWHDPTQWPVSSRKANEPRRLADRQSDPTEKGGIVGAFCKVFSIDDAIDEFLPDKYSKCSDGRYTYLGGSTSGGLVVYDNGKFAFSHHSTDPTCGKLCNAFDLVRIHLFGDEDENTAPNTPATKLPSYKSMCDKALSVPAVQQELKAEQLSSVVAVFDDAENTEWVQALEINPRTGKPAATVDNVFLILTHDPRLKGRYYYDEFRARPIVCGALPWDTSSHRVSASWLDTDDAGLRWLLERDYKIDSAPKVRDAVDLAIDSNKIHPVRDYLHSLEWDGQPRAEMLFIDYLGAEDSRYTRAVTRKALIGAVARILRPGCKHDHMLVLVGPQGCRKSTTLAKLGKQWFSDSLYTMTGKDAYEQLQGNWIIELAEMAATRKAEIEQIKQFVSKQEDTYRAAYARRTQSHPRQCAFFGTTNDDEFLRDPTGARRFWPVTVTKAGCVNGDKLTPEIVDQIWAEVVTYYDNGETWYLDNEVEEIARKVQSEHTETNGKLGLIENFIETLLPAGWDTWDLDRRLMFWSGGFGPEQKGTMRRTRVCALEIWQELFKGDPKNYTTQHAREITGLLKSLPEWSMTTATNCGALYGRQRGFIRKER